LAHSCTFSELSAGLDVSPPVPWVDVACAHRESRPRIAPIFQKRDMGGSTVPARHSLLRCLDERRGTGIRGGPPLDSHLDLILVDVHQPVLRGPQILHGTRKVSGVDVSGVHLCPRPHIIAVVVPGAFDAPFAQLPFVQRPTTMRTAGVEGLDLATMCTWAATLSS
jgi:hypothetical protein